MSSTEERRTNNLTVGGGDSTYIGIKKANLRPPRAKIEKLGDAYKYFLQCQEQLARTKKDPSKELKHPFSGGSAKAVSRSPACSAKERTDDIGVQDRAFVPRLVTYDSAVGDVDTEKATIIKQNVVRKATPTVEVIYYLGYQLEKMCM